MYFVRTFYEYNNLSMPNTKEGMHSIETQVPEKWVQKIERLREKKGMTSRLQFLRDLIYLNLKKEGEL